MILMSAIGSNGMCKPLMNVRFEKDNGHDADVVRSELIPSEPHCPHQVIDGFVDLSCFRLKIDTG